MGGGWHHGRRGCRQSARALSLPGVPRRQHLAPRGHLSAAATAAVGIRLGVYASDDDGLPAAKLGELAAPIAVANGQAAGVLSGALAASVPVEEGKLYFTAFVCDAAGVTLTSVGTAEFIPVFGVDGAFAKNTKMHRAFTYGALPADESALGVTDYISAPTARTRSWAGASRDGPRVGEASPDEQRARRSRNVRTSRPTIERSQHRTTPSKGGTKSPGRNHFVP
jgi:hypothetical protein